MRTETLLLFSTASIALAVIPGPTMLLALSNGMAGGLRRAGFGIAGASLGSSCLIALVALGLGSLLAASEVLFHALRVAGIAYLCWLGVGLWRSPAPDLALAAASVPARQVAGRVAFRRSLLVALTNPKAILFFAAFLPQFVDTAAPQGAQYAVLGGIFVGQDILVMLLYASAGRQAVRWLSQRGLRCLNRGCAAGMWALAALLALYRRHAA
ncbi:LysE family transporter [Ramlibacter sp. H39-3-26]|uniref:LysE family translocator n=1 Tax=Curvibacter soli TaxID=3031331 RepID=UPI0023DBE7B8|nr:LysE family transporter [Ramlibacter sp. H39-3-26]MDF1485208.1 LysE family transporter [Ramlibacter sp. H39-3-26]